MKARRFAVFTVDGKPEGKGRPRWDGRNKRMYTPGSTKVYESAVAWACRAAMGGLKPKKGPVEVLVVANKKVPAHVNKRTREMMRDGKIKPVSRPDLDNVIKSVLDGCNGIAYEDDAQVVTISAYVQYSDTPCVYVEMYEEV